MAPWKMTLDDQRFVEKSHRLGIRTGMEQVHSQNALAAVPEVASGSWYIEAYPQRSLAEFGMVVQLTSVIVPSPRIAVVNSLCWRIGVRFDRKPGCAD